MEIWYSDKGFHLEEEDILGSVKLWIRKGQSQL
jgi:hypothetical protein